MLVLREKLEKLESDSSIVCWFRKKLNLCTFPDQQDQGGVTVDLSCSRSRCILQPPSCCVVGSKDYFKEFPAVHLDFRGRFCCDSRPCPVHGVSRSSNTPQGYPISALNSPGAIAVLS